jgi:hypothetical protein
MSTIENLRSSSQTGEEIGSKTEGVNKKDNPFLAKEGDIMLTELNDKDRIVLQEKLKGLVKNSKSLRLNYQDRQKRLGELKVFKEELGGLMEYLNTVYVILKSENIKNIDELSFQEDRVSNFDLESDLQKINDFTFGSKKSLISLFSYCSNLYQKIALKENEIKEFTEDKTKEKELELEEEMLY